ncbi:MAG: (2Fe-2S)-binding protein [Actinomycetia bacterium]|nr:(2Fe-2S)-binding protein [Actinomycetes bacterium]
MYVCICHAVTRAELDDVLARGARSLDAVGESCGAGTGCGSCVERLSCLISTAGPRFAEVRLDATSVSV